MSEGSDCCHSSFPGHRLGVFSRIEICAEDRRLTATISGGEKWEKGAHGKADPACGCRVQQ